MGCRAQGLPTIGCQRDKTIHLTQKQRFLLHDRFFWKRLCSWGKQLLLSVLNWGGSRSNGCVLLFFEALYSHWKEARLCFRNLHLSAKIIFSFFSSSFFKIFFPHRLNTSHHKTFLATAVLLSLSIWKANSMTLFSLTEFTSNANDGRPGFCFPCCQGGSGDSGCDKLLWRSNAGQGEPSQGVSDINACSWCLPIIFHLKEIL